MTEHGYLGLLFLFVIVVALSLGLNINDLRRRVAIIEKHLGIRDSDDELL